MSVSRPGRIVLAAAAVLALGVCAAPGAAQFGEAAAAQYAGQPASHWQNLLAQHLDKETDEDKEECRRAAQALGQIGPPAQAAIPLLVRALQSPAVEVRGFAVDALGRIGQQPESVVPAIVAEADLPPAHINYAPLAPFRCLAARALGRLGPKAVAAVPMLERALQNEDPLYRVQAAWALWEIAQHPQALPTLRAVLKQTDSEAAFGAALALAQLDDAAPSAAADLIEALDHPDADVRRAAASALVALGGSDWETVAARLLQGEFRAPAAARPIGRLPKSRGVLKPGRRNRCCARPSATRIWPSAVLPSRPCSSWANRKKVGGPGDKRIPFEAAGVYKLIPGECVQPYVRLCRRTDPAGKPDVPKERVVR